MTAVQLRRSDMSNARERDHFEEGFWIARRIGRIVAKAIDPHAIMIAKPTASRRTWRKYENPKIQSIVAPMTTSAFFALILILKAQ